MGWVGGGWGLGSWGVEARVRAAARAGGCSDGGAIGPRRKQIMDGANLQKVVVGNFNRLVPERGGINLCRSAKMAPFFNYN